MELVIWFISSIGTNCLKIISLLSVHKLEKEAKKLEAMRENMRLKGETYVPEPAN